MQRMNLGHRPSVILRRAGRGQRSRCARTGAGRHAATLTMSGAKEHADQDTRLELDLLREGNRVLRRRGAGPRRAQDGRDLGPARGLVTTDELGHAELEATMARRAADNVFRATYAGNATTYAGSRSGPVASRWSAAAACCARGPGLGGGRGSVPIEVTWRTGTGDPVAGGGRGLSAAAPGGWTGAVRTGADGRSRRVPSHRAPTPAGRPGPRLAWVEGARSGVHRIDNLPPGIPVRLPGAAPQPAAQAARPGARRRQGATSSGRSRTGLGQMTGVSWHRGCPVGRDGLRLVRVNYWDYNGYAAAASSSRAPAPARDGGRARRDVPPEAADPGDVPGRPVRLGHRVRGGDDYASMAAGNTSAFNCRDVTGQPGVRSPHSWGRSLDVNTWENPYRSAQGTVPNTWWHGRSHPRVAWRSRSHPVVAMMAGTGCAGPTAPATPSTSTRRRARPYAPVGRLQRRVCE